MGSNPKTHGDMSLSKRGENRSLFFPVFTRLATERKSIRAAVRCFIEAYLFCLSDCRRLGFYGEITPFCENF